MEFETGKSGPAFVVRYLDDRLDAAVASEFRDRVREIAQTASGPVILDLSRIDFLDSSGLGAIVGVMKALAPGRRLELAAPTPNVERVLRLTRMDTVFTIHPLPPDVGATHAA